MRARVFSVSEVQTLRKAGGPFVGPRGGLWADPQHTIAWDPERHGKITPHNCPVCRGLGHIIRRQTHAFGEADEITSGFCRTCNKTGKVPLDPAKVKALGLPMPTPAKQVQAPVPASAPRSEQFNLLSYRAKPQQASLFGEEPKKAPPPPPPKPPPKGQLALGLEKSLPVKQRLVVGGIPIAIENPKGSVRHWYDPVKQEHGSTKMRHPYGYIRGTTGADGEEVDVFVGPHRESKLAVIINQRRVDDLRRFDEHKVMLGFRSAKEAREAYLRNYDAKGPKLMGTVRVWSLERLKSWLEGKVTEPAEKSL